MTTACPGCGASFAPSDGPTHRYMESSPGCWAAFGGVLAREYSNPAFMRFHRLTVDAYAVQHPGRPSPQTIQSVAVHLIGLYGTFVLDLPSPRVTRGIQRAADRAVYAWLEPPADRGALTVLHVLPAANPDDHSRAVQAWARAAWNAWSPHHGQVEAWVRQVAVY